MLQKLHELNLAPNREIRIYDTDEELFAGQYKKAKASFDNCSVVTTYDCGSYLEIYIPSMQKPKRIIDGEDSSLSKRDFFFKVFTENENQIKKDIDKGLFLCDINHKYFKKGKISVQYFARLVNETPIRAYYKEVRPSSRELFFSIKNKYNKKILSLLNEGKSYTNIYNMFFLEIAFSTFQNYIRSYCRDWIDLKDKQPTCQEFIQQNLNKMKEFPSKRAFFKYIAKETGYSVYIVSTCYYIVVGGE